MPPRIYTDNTLITDQQIDLDKKASRHIVKVLRLNAGESLSVFNGDGRDYSAVLVRSAKTATIRITGSRNNPTESPLKVTLAQGISRGDRMDYCLQKSVELGVHAIQPLMTEKSSIKLDVERLDKKHRHWREILISACEQCGRSVVPQLAGATTLKDWLDHYDKAVPLQVLQPDATTALARAQSAIQCTVAIGPESGFSARELALFKQVGAQTYSLGPRVLRTETAAVAALSVLQLQGGDFG